MKAVKREQWSIVWDGRWGTLCNDEQSQLSFSEQVLCRQLGFAPECMQFNAYLNITHILLLC